MVYKNLDSSVVKGPYQKVRKGHEQQRQHSNQETAKKPNDDKYGAWGAVYKNKQNFVDMHCG